MKFDEYINWRISNGEVDLDGAYGYQCMDLYNEYCQKVLELTGNTGADYAKNIIHNQYVKENFEFIYNYPDFVPEKRRCCCLAWWYLRSRCYMSWAC